MLDLKNMDPIVVAELIGQIKDLAKALVSILLVFLILFPVKIE